MKHKWPQGRQPTQVKNKIKKLTSELLTGTVLAIDPASGKSSMPGWAEFHQGKLVGSGTIPINSRLPIQGRLGELAAYLEDNWYGVDVLVIEMIRGHQAHYMLSWSVGTTIANVGSAELIEIPTSFWKVLADSAYEKGDEQDAILIGTTAITLAKEMSNEE